MDPVQRFPSPVFKTDEDYKLEFEKLYDRSKKILAEQNEISVDDIIGLSADVETARLIKELLEEEFLANKQSKT